MTTTDSGYLMNIPSIKVSSMCTMENPCKHLVSVNGGNCGTLMTWPAISDLLKKHNIMTPSSTFPHTFTDTPTSSSSLGYYNTSCPTCCADLPP